MADLDKYSYHEAMDRAHVANDHFNEYVETHPVVQAHKELKDAAEKVTSQMYNFYCLCGAFLDKRCDHEWGTDGQHQNEFCKKCFITKPTDI